MANNRRSSHPNHPTGATSSSTGNSGRQLHSLDVPSHTDTMQSSSRYKPLKYSTEESGGILITDDLGNGSSSTTLPTISGTLGQSPQYHNFSKHNSQYGNQMPASHHQQPQQRYFYATSGVGHSAPGLGGHYKTNLSQQAPPTHRSKSFAGRVFADFMNSATGSDAQPQQSNRRTSPGGVDVITGSPISGPPSPPVSDESLGLGSPCSGSLCVGIRELLASLGLMCILSLLMAFLALFFLHKSCAVPNFVEETTVQTLSANNASKTYRTYNANAQSMGASAPQRLVSNAREYNRVHQISVSLSTLTIALDLCCLFVSCVQFLAIVKLIKNPYGKRRSLEFIKKTSHIRIVAIGAFLLSIPIFFTGIILYTFVNFDELPALITSLVIGCGIIFCGIASVQNVYLWQWEKTKASEDARYARRQSQLPYRSLLTSAASSTQPPPTALLQPSPSRQTGVMNTPAHHPLHHSQHLHLQQQQQHQPHPTVSTVHHHPTAHSQPLPQQTYAPQIQVVQDHLSTLV